MDTKPRFFASKEGRGVWSVWDRKHQWWAIEPQKTRWLSKKEAEQVAKQLNEQDEAQA